MKQYPSFNPPPRLDPFQEIPIVLRLYDFYRVLHITVKLFPKLDKHSLGQQLLQKTLILIETILFASRLPGPTKREALLRANSQLDLTKLLVRLAVELPIIEQKKYIELEQHLYEIGNMLGGWLRSLK